MTRPHANTHSAEVYCLEVHQPAKFCPDVLSTSVLASPSSPPLCCARYMGAACAASRAALRHAVGWYKHLQPDSACLWLQAGMSQCLGTLTTTPPCCTRPSLWRSSLRQYTKQYRCNAAQLQSLPMVQYRCMSSIHDAWHVCAEGVQVVGAELAVDNCMGGPVGWVPASAHCRGEAGCSVPSTPQCPSQNCSAIPPPGKQHSGSVCPFRTVHFGAALRTGRQSQVPWTEQRDSLRPHALLPAG